MNDQRAKPAPVLDIAIPVYNEERVLEQSVRALHAHVRARIPFSTRLTIVDNASDDGTRLIGMRLATELENVRFMHLAEKGRGRALRSAWMSSDARVLAYMDVDRSLLVIAQRHGFRIHEIPVAWVEDPDSRVNIPRTVLTDLRGVLRMRRQAQFARSGVRAHAVQPQEVR